MGFRRIFVILLFAALGTGCSTEGLLTERYEPEFYRIPRLLPEGPLGENPTFIVYGDTQPAWRIYDGFMVRENWLTWKMLIFPFYEIYWLANGLVGAVNFARGMPDYGQDGRVMMRDAVYLEAQRWSAAFILNTGDVTGPDGRQPDHWAIFLRENKHEHPLVTEVPYLPTVGNHDRASDTMYGRPNYEAVFDYPPFYTVESPDMALFVVDTNIALDWRGDIGDDLQDDLFEEWFVSSDPDRPAWLERELADCDKAFKVVSMHHSPFSFGPHWKDWIEPKYGRDVSQKRKLLVNLFQKHGVQVVFSGHDHIYQHNVLRNSVDNPFGVERIHFIVSSGGGAPIRAPRFTRTLRKIRQHYLQEGFDVQYSVQRRVYHYCLVRVDASQMRIQTFEVEKNRAPRLWEEIVIPKP